MKEAEKKIQKKSFSKKKPIADSIKTGFGEPKKKSKILIFS
jgi:hypothetical protein